MLAATGSGIAFADVLETDTIVGKSAQGLGLDASDSPDLSARNALLIEQDGDVLFARDMDKRVKIASLTKIMTAIVAIENARLDTIVTVDDAAANVGESTAGLKKGDSFTLETALYALMVPSGNDASVAIAKAVGETMTGEKKGAYDAFVAAMNEKAAALGCENTNYTNPHGLDFGKFKNEDCYSTAADVGILVAYAMQNETFRETVHSGDTVIEVTSADGSTRSLELTSTDELIGVYDGICGVKTGTTFEADYCFAGAVSRKKGEFYSVVLGAPTSDDRFRDTTTLMDWAYGNTINAQLINASSFVDSSGNSVPHVAEIAHNDWADVTVPATVKDPELSALVFKLKGPVTQEATYNDLTGDIKAGDVVGTLTFRQNGEKIASCKLIAAADQEAPGFFRGIGVWVERLYCKIVDEPTVARSRCLNGEVSLGI